MIHCAAAVRAMLVLSTLVIASCDNGEPWSVEYLKVEAKSIGAPVSEDKLKDPESVELFDWQASAQVADPNALVQPPQTVAVVRSLGTREGDHDDCTGFFVSKRDFLTAKHCIDPEEPIIDVNLGKGHKGVKAECSEFSGSEIWMDWAICSLKGLKKELVLSPFPLAKCAPAPGTLVLISGFCNTSGQANAGVVQLLAPVDGFLPAVPLKNRSTTGCPLDSGGPAFIAKELQDSNGGVFVASDAVRVVGILSKIRECPKGESNRTCIAPTTQDEFFEFLEENKTADVTILDCGE